MTSFLRFEAVTTRIALWAAIGFLLVATGTTMFQVLSRFVLTLPVPWAESVARAAMIWAVFLGVSASFRSGNMIALEQLQHHLPRRLGLSLHLLSLGLSLVFFALLFWQSWVLAERFSGQVVPALDVSIVWVYAAMVVGAAFVCISVVGCMLRALRGDWPTSQIPGEGES